MNPIFEKNILVKFGDADPQGILYSACSYKLAHECLEEFWAQSKLGWNFWFQNPEFAVPIRHSACDYMAPMKAGQNYKATLSLGKLGDSSIEFICEFSHSSSHTPCAKVTTVHVFVEQKGFTKISIPGKIRELLSN